MLFQSIIFTAKKYLNKTKKRGTGKGKEEKGKKKRIKQQKKRGGRGIDYIYNLSTDSAVPYRQKSKDIASEDGQ